MVQAIIDLLKRTLDEHAVRLAVGFAIVLGAMAYGSVWVYEHEINPPEQRAEKAEKEKREAELNEAVAKKALAHGQKHMFEPLTWTLIADSKKQVAEYQSDACVALKDEHGHARLILPDDDDLKATWFSLPVAHAQEVAGGGRCWQGHGGQPPSIQRVYGPCLIEDRYSWQDGCWGNVISNTCGGGGRMFTWQRCVH